MKSVFALVALAAAAVQPALGHYRFFKLIDSAGTVTGEYQYVRSNTNTNSPVTDVTSTDFRCNVGGLASGSKTSISTVAAGSTVGFQSDIGKSLPESADHHKSSLPLTPVIAALLHPGPLQVYLGKVPSGQTAATWDGSGANWFKIYAIGASFSSGSLAWPTDNQSTFKFKIPSGVPAGNYLLRVEHIALHGASTQGGAQFYVSVLPVTHQASKTEHSYARLDKLCPAGDYGKRQRKPGQGFHSRRLHRRV
ncbi:hypothetical protein FRC06_004767 [Ceratobasidium sp. 370]|nr:hypothetical protein FRC06_004767 [Ceratobasidium sp. 370]